jgi:hypothetical protein
MRKLLIEDEKPTFQIIGISSLLKDYRLCFFLNSVFELDLKLLESDFKLNFDKVTKSHEIRFYHGANTLKNLEVYLFSNKQKDIFLLPELKKLDYGIKVFSLDKIDEKVKQINNIEGIETAMILPLQKIKSLHNIQQITIDLSDKTLWQLNKTKQKQ